MNSRMHGNCILFGSSTPSTWKRTSVSDKIPPSISSCSCYWHNQYKMLFDPQALGPIEFWSDGPMTYLTKIPKWSLQLACTQNGHSEYISNSAPAQLVRGTRLVAGSWLVAAHIVPTAYFDRNLYSSYITFSIITREHMRVQRSNVSDISGRWLGLDRHQIDKNVNKIRKLQKHTLTMCSFHLWSLIPKIIHV